MNILILGGGVIGAVHAWQFVEAGHKVTLLVRPGRRQTLERDGLHIRGTDERHKPAAHFDLVFRAPLVEVLSDQAGYDLILVCVRSHQVDQVLPMLAEGAGQASVLFFQNNWRGDAHIKSYLSPRQYLFGFSRVVGGWRSGYEVECILFNGPGQVTMLGEVDGRASPRLHDLSALFQQAGLKPEISPDILGWLAAHYVEYLGPIGGILQAGSAAAFAKDAALVREAILATREGLAVCRARGIGSNAWPQNLKLFSLPLTLTVRLGQMSYGMPSIQQFFQENIAHGGLAELSIQYQTILDEAERLGVPVPHLQRFEPSYLHAEPVMA